MTETSSCVEKDALIDFLYGEADADARTRVEAHLRVCAQCADEVVTLRQVRGTLEAWVPPEAELGFRLVSDADPEPAPVSFWRQLQRRPVWGLAAAAAVLVLAAAAFISKPEVQFGRDGMVVRIGWTETGSEALSQASTDLASRSDLAVLSAEVRRLIRESEQRQDRAVTARVQQVEQQIENRRRSDLVEMQRAFAEFGVTGGELVRRDDLFDLLTRISGR